MRQVINWNRNWEFQNESTPDPALWEQVSLPHTWNALDGQDGGGDYAQGIGCYRKRFTVEPGCRELYVRFGAVSKTARVLCNGHLAGEHAGGFSAFTVNLTPFLREGENEILVFANNSNDLPVYPQNADFTFFGGIYRDVQLLCFDGEAHFDVTAFGTDPLFVTAAPDGRVRVVVCAPEGTGLHVQIRNPDGSVAASGDGISRNGKTELTISLAEPKLWDGLEAPNLYTCTVSMPGDEISTTFGFRSFRVSAEEGFFLNDRRYPLHGVCRHQDRENMGWALTEKEHLEDMALIREIGANTIRLAHYQQAPFFYDLCDRNGMVVWAEIPFISVYDDRREADENLRTQLRELILQNYNHPSICFWGIANELGIGGESERMIAMLRELNTLAKELDPSRLTTIANVGMTMPESEQFHITDVASYNEYMGWYEGTPDDHGTFCDARHSKMPQVPLAISEYGADSVLSWHSAQPKCKDYTEEYQAIVHEKAYAAFERRPYLWATWLWNMFDFAADARDEGGCKGRNNKGLVTFDRAVKKQGYFFYKAKWSAEPFVYICGKRFCKRHEDVIDVKLYSNAPEVTLWVNGKPVGKQAGNAVFTFPGVALTEPFNELIARIPGGQTDTLILEKVAQMPGEYTYVVQKDVSSNVAQWFASQKLEVKELVIREGYLSVEDPLELVYQYPEGERAVKELIQKPLSIDHPAMAARMDKGGAMSFASIWNHISKLLPDEALYLLNERLNKIPK